MSGAFENLKKQVANFVQLRHFHIHKDLKIVSVRHKPKRTRGSLGAIRTGRLEAYLACLEVFIRSRKKY